MCGLVGMAGNLGKIHNDMFRDMLIFDQVRGLDSTGVCFVRLNNNEPVVEKELGGASNLWDWNNSELFSDSGYPKGLFKLLMGHNRAATKGKIILDNAHPFTFDHVTGAHNGTLWDWDDLEGHKELDVDSQCIFKHTSLHGIKDTWGNMRGDAAITYWDSEEGTLNIIRNKGRPLVYCKNKTDNVIIWASELWMIMSAAGRNNVELLRDDEGKVLYWTFEEDVHYKFEVTSINYKLLGKEKLEGKKYVVSQPHIKNGSKRSGGCKSHKVVSSSSEWRHTQWAEGLEKTDKEDFSGKIVHKVSWMYKFDSGQPKKFLRFEFEDDNGDMPILHAYCDTYSSYLDWCTIVSGKKSDELKFRLKARPRIKVKGQNSILVIACDTSALEKIKEVKKSNNVIPLRDLKKEDYRSSKIYVGNDGNDVSYSEILSQLKEAGDVCAYCSQILQPKDSKHLFWMNKQTCYCPHCIDQHTAMFK